MISTTAWSQASRIFDDDLETVQLAGFSKTESRLYVEHGLTNWLTLVGNGGLQTLSFEDETSRFEFEGLDDVELGLQFKAYAREGLAASVRLSYVINSKVDNRVVDVLGGGDQIELRGLIGQSRETFLGDVFYDAQFALRSEALDSLDAVQGALTVGYKPTTRWLIMVQSYANFSKDEVIDGFDVPEQFQLNAHLSVARQMKPGRYFQVGTGRSILGRNIVQENSLFFGFWTEY